MKRQYRLMLMITLGLPLASAAEVYELPPPGNDVVGAVTTVRARVDDSLLDLARRHGLGYEDIVRANPEVDTWLPGEGTEVVLPTRYVLPPGPRRGIVLNLPEYRLYYYPQPEQGKPALVMTYPISIGRMDWQTPLGQTSIVAMARNPAWYPPESVRAEHEAEGDPLPRVVPPGPRNPLGAYAMRLGLPGYLIHSTNRPAGVGMRVTHGCIRMFPEDIDFLFHEVRVKTPVRIIDEPIKVGWDGDELVVEAHRALAMAPVAEETLEPEGDVTVVEANAADAVSTVAPIPPIKDQLTTLTEQFVAATNARRGVLDWDVAESVLDRADGIPAAAGWSLPDSENKDAASSAASD